MKKYAFLAGAFLGSMAFAADKVQDTPHQVLYVTEGTFAEVKSNVEMAITDQGLVINNVSTVGDMLQRTGEDLGATRQVYLHADVLEFCSAGLSREMMEADVANIVFCPYTVQVYATPEEPDKVFVGYRRVPPVGKDASRAAIEKVNALLEKIVSEALSW